MNERWGVPASAGRERDWPQELVLPIALAGGGGDAAVHTHQAIDPTAELVRLTDTMQKLVVIDFEGDGDLGIMFSLRAAGIVVDEICKDSCSAEETGLHVGMVLREVDGEPTSVLGFRRAMFHLGEAWRTRNAVELAFMPTGAHEVRAWLASLDCEEYCSTFEIFGVSRMADLSYVEEADLPVMGLRPAQAQKVHRAIQALFQPSSPTSADAEAVGGLSDTSSEHGSDVFSEYDELEEGFASAGAVAASAASTAAAAAAGSKSVESFLDSLDVIRPEAAPPEPSKWVEEGVPPAQSRQGQPELEPEPEQETEPEPQPESTTAKKPQQEFKSTSREHHSPLHPPDPRLAGTKKEAGASASYTPEGLATRRQRTLRQHRIPAGSVIRSAAGEEAK